MKGCNIKRLFDILFSLLVLLLFLPLAIPIIVLLRFTGEGEIFYLQNRIGKDRRIFKLIKFATMLKDSPNLATGDITVQNDPRVLPFGRILRKTKLNEMPQFLNVLFGQMSVVGPRPLTPGNFQYYNERQQDIISRLKPGLTGIGSIVFRDEEIFIANSGKSYIDCYKQDIAPYKGRLEEWYNDNKGFFIDMCILFLTFWVIVFPSSYLYQKLFKTLPVMDSDNQRREAESRARRDHNMSIVEIKKGTLKSIERVDRTEERGSELREIIR
jgi:lipopolysaccharide/colanic/teichoic acid biosynthesis glycosyltransferase